MIRFLQTPGPIKKVILSSILLIFCGAMVITLIPGGLGGGSSFGSPGRGVVAKVDGEQVTAVEVQREARSMLRDQLPRGSEMSAQLLPFFASRAAQRLISLKALLAEAQRLGLHATEDDVRDELQHGQYAAVFFPGGNFIGQDAYEERLREADLTVPMFEQNIKDQVLYQKLRGLVTGGATVTDAEVRQEFDKRNTKVKFDYAVLKKDDLLKEIHPTDPELKAFYDSHLANYNNANPEKRKLNYVLVDVAKIAAQTTVTPEEIRAYYDQHRDEYRVPDQVNARHILIKTPLPGPDGKIDPKGVQEARSKAEDVLKQLQAGAKFDDLAKKYSQDSESAKNGGSLGWIQHGRFPSADVDKAAFSLPKGGTSGVIDAGYGFDIVHIDDIQTAHAKTLDEVKSEIEPIVKQQKAAGAAEAMANTVLGQARSEGLEKAAAAKGLQVINTDFVDRSAALPGVGTSAQFADAVFQAKEKSPPDQVQVQQGYAIFEVVAVQPPSTPTLDQIHARVETDFKNDRVRTLLTQKTQELSDRAKAEHDLKKAAKELGATNKTSDFVLPDGQVPDLGSMSGNASVAFTMKPGDISGPIQTGVNGVVIELLEKQSPADQEFAAKKDEVRESLLQQKQNEMFGLFTANLQEQMKKSGKIKINQEELKQLTRGLGGDEGE